jgi:hypothetical protein
MTCAVALVGSLIGCLGPLSYRPPKKVEPVAKVASPSKDHLPPQPDQKANNATLKGIETTGQGVRDDIYIWIFTNYTTSVKRAALTGLAQNLQRIVVSTPKTTETAVQLQRSLLGAQAVVKAIPGLKPGEADDMDRQLDKLTVNTPERLKAYLEFNLLHSP